LRLREHCKKITETAVDGQFSGNLINFNLILFEMDERLNCCWRMCPYRIACKKVCVCLIRRATASGSQTLQSYCSWTRKISSRRRSRNHLSRSAFPSTMVSQVCRCICGRCILL